MRSTYSHLTGRKVVVQIGEDAIGGTITATKRGAVTLSAAALIGSRPVQMDGHVIVPAAGIRWVQVLDG